MFVGWSASLESHPPRRRSQSAPTPARYDRLARFYSTLEPLYLIFPPARRRAVSALGLKAGDTVLEIGAGTGRNFPYLVEAVGPSGTVIGVDASQGMLAEARKLIERRGWSMWSCFNRTPRNSRSIAILTGCSSVSATRSSPNPARR